MTPPELLVFGVPCYLLVFVSGAVPIPWLIDHGLFQARRHGGEP